MHHHDVGACGPSLRSGLAGGVVASMDGHFNLVHYVIYSQNRENGYLVYKSTFHIERTNAQSKVLRYGQVYLFYPGMYCRKPAIILNYENIDKCPRNISQNSH